ncbi:hypothetical protein D3C87_2206820 [compost metagenome]
MRFEAPITLVGRTALSVDTSTKYSTADSMAARAMFKVPKTLFMMPSAALHSTSGTCL